MRPRLRHVKDMVKSGREKMGCEFDNVAPDGVRHVCKVGGGDGGWKPRCDDRWMMAVIKGQKSISSFNVASL